MILSETKGRSVLSAAERAMIDAAVAAGRVTVAPVGLSGLPVMRWCPVAKSVVYADKAQSQAWRANVSKVYMPKGKRGRPKGPERAAKPATVDPALVARREAVAAAHARGLTNREIAAEVGITDKQVSAALRVQNLVRNAATPGPKCGGRTWAQRREELEAMLVAGATRAAMSAHFGCTSDALRNAISAQGLAHIRARRARQ